MRCTYVTRMRGDDDKDDEVNGGMMITRWMVRWMMRGDDNLDNKTYWIKIKGNQL